MKVHNQEIQQQMWPQQPQKPQQPLEQHSRQQQFRHLAVLVHSVPPLPLNQQQLHLPVVKRFPYIEIVIHFRQFPVDFNVTTQLKIPANAYITMY